MRSDMARLILVAISWLILAALADSAAPTITYNVASFGARPDGKTDSSKALLSAWAKACASRSSAVIYVPPGRFFLEKAVFGGGQCKNTAITLRIAGTLVAPSDYRVIGDAGNWIFFENVDGVTISGGVLDGQGAGLWACKHSGKSCPSGATVRFFFFIINAIYFIFCWLSIIN